MEEDEDIFENLEPDKDLTGIEDDIVPYNGNDDDFFGLKPDVEVNPVISGLLKAKGIEGSKILLIDENNEEQEVDFYSLSPAEQLEILQGEEAPNDILQGSEQQFIEYLRANNMTLEDYFEKYKDEIVSEVSKPTEQTYDIDAYDDQELFLLDLKTKFDLSDEELIAELEKELQNEAVFNKKVSRLREDYKKLEDEYKQEQEAEFNKQRDAQYNQFVDTMIEQAEGTPEFHGIELEDNEKTEILSFILDLDEKGTSNFYKTLNDPKKLYEAAWFLRYGKEAFEAIKDAYEAEITRLKDEKRVIVKKDNNKREINSIHDLN